MSQATDLIANSADARKADEQCQDTIEFFENWPERNARLYSCADGSVVRIDYEGATMSAHADIFEARDATLTQQLTSLTDALADEAAADAGNEGYEAHFAGLVASDNPYTAGVREAKAWEAGRLQARQDVREMAA